MKTKNNVSLISYDCFFLDKSLLLQERAQSTSQNKRTIKEIVNMKIEIEYSLSTSSYRIIHITAADEETTKRETLI